MNKILLVLKHEFITTVMRRSFILTLVLIPLASLLVILVISWLQRSEGASPISSVVAGQPPTSEVQGLVDHSGLVRAVPEEWQERLRLFPDEDAARQALDRGEIAAFFVVNEDYLETGAVDYYRPDFNPLGGFEESSALEDTLNANLLENQPMLLERIRNPIRLETEYLDERPQRDPESGLTFFVPYAVTFLFYFLILSSASLLLNSITTEKQNRVMEILMTSITPMQMLVGKTIALGLVGLLQTIVWGSAGLGLLRLSRSTLNISAAFQLPVTVLLWGLVFFVLGYGVYASLMAGVGALVPNLREGSQATTIVIIPLIVPLMFITPLIQRPDSAISIGLSLFPLTAPVSMMTRLASNTPVPIWQPLLAVLLLLLTGALIIRSVAGMFRAQTLLSGQPFKLKTFFAALLGRA